MHTHFLFFFYLFYFSVFFIFLSFWAGPSSAHMGWARPSRPGWAKEEEARVNYSRMLATVLV
jgi:hypothetical protein